MGIRKLRSLLEKYDVKNEYSNIYEFKKNKGKLVIAIDTMLYFYKYSISLPNPLIGFLNQILYLKSKKIIPIYVIDGISPQEKKLTIEKRKKKKKKIEDEIKVIEDNFSKFTHKHLIDVASNKLDKLNKLNVKITNLEINKLTELFKILNVQFIRAKGEADSLISYLFKNNYIDTCLSEDMDLLVFKCESIISFSKSKIIEYKLCKILKNLNLEYENFVELCILLGCDYLNPIMKDKPLEIYKKYILDPNNFILKSDLDDEYVKKFNLVKNKFIDNMQEYSEIKILNTFNKINISSLKNFILKEIPEYNKNNKIDLKIKKINSII